jgi:glyoxylase-like metal-dependent hydrolase (beta-lactamase superfamily II)
MKIEMVTTGSYYTNSYILSNDKNECVIIDPGLNYKKAAEYIKNKYNPIAILITHAHMDNIDGI